MLTRLGLACRQCTHGVRATDGENEDEGVIRSKRLIYSNEFARTAGSPDTLDTDRDGVVW